ncbi:alpha/beta hydrolase [Jiella sonneratiae]|uniref:Alpha/beta hydrolase n=1 Tax=Jiella sonneratiae TaxID=2816856 RepID=A0ABS3J246_9HYPH|nr:alpha/beta hydrolase-fold protein [Jiella sonneratiae]MBO0903732.1 alpha/beta hydrolase [Jiella sonneratiae]
MHERHELSFAGRAYRVFTETVGEPPEAGWPVALILDADQFFERAAEMAGARAAPCLLVGVGLPEEDAAARIARRYFELTDRAAAGAIPTRPGQDTPETGGERLFAGMLRWRLLPWLEELYPLAAGRMAVFGHSLAGLFVLRAFLRRELPIADFLAADPSVWWNRHRVMAELDAFVAGRPDHVAHDQRRLTILAAGRKADRPSLSRAERAAVGAVRGGPNGLAFGARLADAGHRHVTIVPMPEETHGSIVGPALERFLSIAGEDRTAAGSPGL